MRTQLCILRSFPEYDKPRLVLAHVINSAMVGLFLVFFFAGCTQTIVYDSNLPPTPLMKQAGEIYIAPSYGTNGVNVNAAAAFLGQFEVAGSMLYNESGSDRLNIHDVLMDRLYQDSHIFRYYEFMGGAFFPFEEHMVFELFFGTGQGTAEDYTYSHEIWEGKDATILKTESGSFKKIFAQLNIGKRTKTSKSGFALRCSYIDFNQYQKAHSKRGIVSTGTPSGILWEPTFFAEIGGDNVRLAGEIVYPFEPHELEFGVKSFVISVGLVVSIL